MVVARAAIVVQVRRPEMPGERFDRFPEVAHQVSVAVIETYPDVDAVQIVFNQLAERCRARQRVRNHLERHLHVDARGDLEELLLRHRRLASRKAAVEAALLSLPDAVEEIYQAIITNSSAAEGGARLTEAIERLRLEEELESSYGAEIQNIVRPEAAAARARSAARQGAAS